MNIEGVATVFYWVTDITDTGSARFASYEDPDGNLSDILERLV